MTTNANPATSQRQATFRGGIPQGLSATSLSSRSLETITMGQLVGGGTIADAAAEGIGWRKGYTGEELKALFGSKLGGTVAGLSPDGGIFEDGDLKRPVLSFECKFQGEKGNAIERWFKNYAVMERLGIDRYVTFTLGDGFWTGSAERILAVAASMEPGRTGLWDDPAAVIDPTPEAFPLPLQYCGRCLDSDSPSRRILCGPCRRGQAGSAAGLGAVLELRIPVYRR